MLNLALATIAEKNRIAGGQPWYLLVDATLDGGGTPDLRLARNSADVTFQGNTYQAFSFDLAMQEDRANGELPSVQLQLSNVNRLIEGYLTQYNGGVGATITIYVVPASSLIAEADLQINFVVTGVTADVDWVTLHLGADNPLRANFPKFIYLANNCRFCYNTPALQLTSDPRGLACGYIGAIASCDKTLDKANGCRVHANSARFGGFPTIDTSGIRSF